MEIMCHYVGANYRASEPEDALFANVSTDAVPLHPASEDFVVLALISIAADISEGKFRVSLAHSKKIQRQDQITLWMSGLEKSLLMLCES